jgi:uridine phosphorylase
VGVPIIHKKKSGEITNMGKKEFIITADKRLNEKELDLEVFNFPIAIFSFFKSMADVETWEKQAARFQAKRINHPQSNNSRLHWGKIIQWPMSIWNIEESGIPIIIVGPVLSGPWVAMALEELNALGLKFVIGVGACGSFSEMLQIDDIVIADNAIISDGTSKEYSKDQSARPSKKLLKMMEALFSSKNQAYKKACVWTIDAMYRETIEKMKRWRKSGAACVNMETGTFYTVSKELGIESIYFSFVLDLIHTEEWTGWGGLDDELKGNAESSRSNLQLVEDLAVELARKIKQNNNFRLRDSRNASTE